jgi:threonine dehydratase
MIAKKAVQKHQRKMQDYQNAKDFFFNDYDLTEDTNDSWLTNAAKKTASVLGIHNNMDSVIAGAGVGSLTYGIHHKKENWKKKRVIGLQLQRNYVLKEGVAKMLTKEVRSLKTLVDMLEVAGRRVTQASDRLCAAIDNRSLYN